MEQGPMHSRWIPFFQWNILSMCRINLEIIHWTKILSAIYYSVIVWLNEYPYYTWYMRGAHTMIGPLSSKPDPAILDETLPSFNYSLRLYINKVWTQWYQPPLACSSVICGKNGRRPFLWSSRWHSLTALKFNIIHGINQLLSAASAKTKGPYSMSPYQKINSL